MSTSNTGGGTAAVAEEMAQPRRSRRSVWRQFTKHKLALVGLGVLVVFGLASAFAPVVAWHGPNKVNLDHVQKPPSWSHPLGTDSAGRDVFSRILHAGRVSLSVGVVATLISVFIGTAIGLVSGYAGGWIDNVLQRFTEYVMNFPTLFALLVLVSILGSSVFIIMIIIGVLGWTGKARLVRGQVLQGRELDYVAAARALGASDMRILFVHILPAVIPFIVVAATLSLAGAIIAESSLSFLGFGVRIPTATWGNMMTSAQSLHTIRNELWLWLSPGVAIATTVIAVNFLGDGLRDALDPRQET